MRVIKLQQKFREHTPKMIWDHISNVQAYPEKIKFVKKVMVDEVKKDGTYTDITTLLWVPCTITHTIKEVDEHKKLSYFMVLPLGGKMSMDYIINERKDHTELYAEVIFDLGNSFYNHTVGHVLEKRLEYMLRNVFPEVKEVIRLR